MTATLSQVQVQERPEDEQLGLFANLAYGFQHVLTMYGGIVAVPLIVGQAAGLSPSEIGLLITASLFAGASYGRRRCLHHLGCGRKPGAVPDPRECHRPEAGHPRTVEADGAELQGSRREHSLAPRNGLARQAGRGRPVQNGGCAFGASSEYNHQSRME